MRSPFAGIFLMQVSVLSFHVACGIFEKTAVHFENGETLKRVKKKM